MTTRTTKPPYTQVLVAHCRATPTRSMLQGLLLVVRTVRRCRQTTKGAVIGRLSPTRLELRSITMAVVSSRVSSFAIHLPPKRHLGVDLDTNLGPWQCFGTIRVYPSGSFPGKASRPISRPLLRFLTVGVYPARSGPPALAVRSSSSRTTG